jgi:hypothetical protein
MKIIYLFAAFLLSINCLYAKDYYKEHYKKNSILIGVHAGYSKFIPSSKIREDKIDNGGGYGGLIIGYDFLINPLLSIGVETGLNYGHNIAHYKKSPLEGDIKHFNTPILSTIKFYIPNNSGLNTFVKIGGTYSKQIAILKDNQREIENKSIKKFIPTAVIGFGWSVDGFNIFAQYTYLFGKQWNKDTSKISEINLALNALTFGITYNIPIL